MSLTSRSGLIHNRRTKHPADRLEADRAAIVALPPVAPTVGWRLTTRLPRDHYVRLDANDYSVHPPVVCRRVDVHADMNRVRVDCDGRPMARHDRCWARHQTLTDPAARAAADQLRDAHRRASVTPIATPVESRDLADYDRMFGLDDLEVARCPPRPRHRPATSRVRSRS